MIEDQEAYWEKISSKLHQEMNKKRVGRFR